MQDKTCIGGIPLRIKQNVKWTEKEEEAKKQRFINCYKKVYIEWEIPDNLDKSREIKKIQETIILTMFIFGDKLS